VKPVIEPLQMLEDANVLAAKRNAQTAVEAGFQEQQHYWLSKAREAMQIVGGRALTPAEEVIWRYTHVYSSYTTERIALPVEVMEKWREIRNAFSGYCIRLNRDMDRQMIQPTSYLFFGLRSGKEWMIARWSTTGTVPTLEEAKQDIRGRAATLQKLHGRQKFFTSWGVDKSSLNRALIACEQSD